MQMFLMCFHGNLTKISLYDFFNLFFTHSNDCVLMNSKKYEFQWFFHSINTSVVLNKTFLGFVFKYRHMFTISDKYNRLNFLKSKTTAYKIRLKFSVYFLALLLHQKESIFIKKRKEMYNAWTLIWI